MASRRERRPSRTASLALLALLAAAVAPSLASGQGMAAANRRAVPPVPLPEGMQPPAVEYVDIAAEAGLAGRRTAPRIQSMTYLPETTGAGVAVVDYNNDGLQDIFLVGSGPPAGDGEGQGHRLYRNLGSLRFRDVTEQAGIAAAGWGQGACAGDFDRDGFADLFVTRWGEDALLRNMEGERFRDEARARGVGGGARRWSTGCSFLDFDRDGDLDLFVARYVDFDEESTPLPGEAPQCAWKGAPIPCGPRGLAGESMSLYANDGTGHFSDVSAAAGIETAKRYHGLGVLAGDFDDDGWVDVFVACDSTANLLYRNRGDGTFEETGLLAGAAYNEDGHEQAGMGVAGADFDGDGLVDLFVTNFAADSNTLYRNRGDGLFRDGTVPAGLATATRFVGWGAVFLDIDLDGWPDIFAANGHVAPSVDGSGINEAFAQPRLLFWNRGDGIFHPLHGNAGTGIGAAHPSRGAAAGDLDNDGDLELVVANVGQPPSLLWNSSAPQGNWLTVRAVARSGSDAIGAKIRVEAGGRTLTGEIRSGDSYLSQSDFRLVFGLGAERSASVTVRWPSEESDGPHEVVANRMISIREGEGP